MIPLWLTLTALIITLAAEAVGIWAFFRGVMKESRAALDLATTELQALRTARVAERLEEYRKLQLEHDARIRNLEMGGSEKTLATFKEFMTRKDFDQRVGERDRQMELLNDTLNRNTITATEVKTGVAFLEKQVTEILRRLNNSR